MKKSAIYLGASAAILAIAGAFTTRDSTKVKNLVGWTRNESTHNCVSQKGICPNNGSFTCRLAGGTILYTRQANGKCENAALTGIE